MSSPSMISRSSPGGSLRWSSVVSTLALALLCACSSNPPAKPQPPTQAPLPPAPVLPRPQPISLEDVAWRVAPQGTFSLDARGYEALSRNLAEITRWAQEASWQLDFYRRTRVAPPEGGTK